MIPFGLSLATAALLLLAHAPVSIWPLVPVALVPLVRLAERPGVPPLRRAAAAYVGGAVLFGVGCRWLAIAAWPNLAMMTVFEAATFPAFVLLLRAVRRRVPLALAVPVAWGAIEFTRSVFPWNGFPWLLLGYAWDGPLVLLQSAEVWGVTGLSFAAALANGLVAAGLASTGRARAVRFAAAAAVPVGLAAYGALRIGPVEAAGASGPRVALVQANVPQVLKNAMRADRIEAMQIGATRDALAAVGPEGVDLVCWAETMLPHGLFHDDGEDQRRRDAEVIGPIVEGVRRAAPGAWFVVGAITGRARDGAGTRPTFDTYNSVLLFDPAGRRVGRYSKSVLVPGGEFVPLRGVLPEFVLDIVRAIAGRLPDLSAGAGPGVLTFETRDGREYRMGPTICYENVYPTYCARVVAQGVDFVLNLSNEAWFGDSAEFDQMEAASRVRAIESRRALVRATNSGISAVYDASGRRLARVEGAGGRDRAIAGHVTAEVPIHGGRTPFVRFGDVLGVAVTLAAAGL
ncbi:MAG: apolipoprotein N-acyltransferase, partial [Planctomycetota bacterium JB042]